MNKYNKSNIMSRAWRIRRECNVSMSISLKSSWAFEKLYEKAEEIGKESGYDYYVSVNNWSKDGENRTYVEVRTYHSHRKLRSVIYKKYVDNMTGEVMSPEEAPKSQKARKMDIRIEDRSGASCVVCRNSYECKDALKGMGFRFNGREKAWEKQINPVAFIDLMAEVAITCSLSTEEINGMAEVVGDFLATSKGASYNKDFADSDLQDRYRAYCESI